MATVKKNVKAVAPAKKAEPAKKVVKEVEEKETRNKQIKAVDFVPVFQKSESTHEVAEHFDRDILWVSAFASRLRKMGVKLKKMPRTSSGGSGGKRLDIDELNSLIDE